MYTKITPTLNVFHKSHMCNYRRQLLSPKPNKTVIIMKHFLSTNTLK